MDKKMCFLKNGLSATISFWNLKKLGKRHGGGISGYLIYNYKFLYVYNHDDDCYDIVSIFISLRIVSYKYFLLRFKYYQILSTYV